MTWIAVAIGGAAVVGAVGSNLAASTQASGQKQAAATQAGELSSIQQLENPFVQAGYGTTQSLSQLLGTAPATGPGGTDSATGLPGGYLTQQFNPTQQQLDQYPGYQFALKTGMQATQNADTPGSGALSGQTLKDLTNFATGTASNYYGQYFNQFQQQQNNIFSRLSGIAQLGQASAGGVASAGTQLGQGIAQAQAGAAASTAGGIVGSTNAVANSPLNYLLAGNLANTSGGGLNTSSTDAANLSTLNAYNASNPLPTIGGS